MRLASAILGRRHFWEAIRTNLRRILPCRPQKAFVGWIRRSRNPTIFSGTMKTVGSRLRLIRPTCFLTFGPAHRKIRARAGRTFQKRGAPGMARPSPTWTYSRALFGKPCQMAACTKHKGQAIPATKPKTNDQGLVSNCRILPYNCAHFLTAVKPTVNVPGRIAHAIRQHPRRQEPA